MWYPKKRGVYGRSRYRRNKRKWTGQQSGSRKRRFTAAVKAINQRSAGFIGIEKKFFDSYVTNGAIVNTCAGAEQDPAANASCLNAIAQGDGESSRDGRKCVIKSVQVKGLLKGVSLPDQPDATPSPEVRVVIFVDQQTNGAQCNSEDVLLDGAGIDVLSLRNMQYSRRFYTLFDRTYTMGAPTFITDGANTGSIVFGARPFSMFKKLNMEVNFTGTTADIANIADNSIHVLAIASGSGVATISYQARVRFVG